MIDRAFLLSHPQYHQKNLELIGETLLSNDYLIEFIFETINARLRSLWHKETLKQKMNDNLSEVTSDKKSTWYTIPYVPIISEKLLKTVKSFDVRPAFYNLNKLNQFIRTQKDILPNNKKKNVYKITYKDCDASYVGQTCRLLKTYRISEPRNNIRKTHHSVIFEHRMHHNHDFNWDNVEIFDNQRFLSKRLISEMVFIKLQNNNLNLQTDTEFLHNEYLTLLNNIKNRG
jgi:hypothetical protein